MVLRYHARTELNGRCFPVARSVSTPVLRTRMTDRNQICSNGRASTVTDVLARPCKCQTPFSGRGDALKRIVNKFRRPAILHLNIESLTTSKISVLYHLATQRETLVILLQETHCTSAQRLVLPDYQLGGFSVSRKHGLATFVHERLKWTLFDQSPPTSETEWLCVDVDGYKIVNVYKPPPIRLQISDLPVFPHPCLYVSDFNCQHVDWTYDANSADGKFLVGCQIPIILYYSITQRMPLASTLATEIQVPTRILHSLVSIRTVVYPTDRKFPRSQHRPSLITPPKFARPVPSKPVKRCDFRKAKWGHYIALTHKLSRTLPPPDSSDMDQEYQRFCNAISTAARKCIPRGRRN